MTTQFSLLNKNFIVSGGTGVLGSSIAEYLVLNQAKVILLGRSLDKLKAKQQELNGIASGSCYIHSVDVMDESALTEISQTIKEEFQQIDGLINLAGGNIPEATLTPEQTIFDIKISDTRKAIELNLYGTVLPTLVFGKLMAEQKSGSIVNISSMAAKQSISRVLGYSIAKSGVDVFTKWMANEMASKFGNKIRVNAIAPGFFIGNQNRALLTNKDGSFTERGNDIIKNTPMARFGDASELNGMVHYLLSEASSFVTGSIFDVDGGFNSFSGV